MATIIPTEPLIFLLQTCDTAFPTGAYAHSQGLEEMVRAGLVADENGLREFLVRHVIPAVTHVDLPIVREARAAAGAGDFPEIVQINRLAGALRVARELREASLQTGRRRLAMLSRVRPSDILARMQAEAGCSASFGHHAVVWGAACAEQAEPDALLAYFYQSVSSFCAASPKLFRIGQEGAQRTLTACLREAGAAVESARAIRREDIGWFDPVLDIASMRHEIAGERLFIS
jgi:urease accessory protein